MDSSRDEERAGLLPSSQHDIEPRYVERRSYKYYLIWIWRFFIFALVGSSSVKVTRYLLVSIAHLNNDRWYYYVAFFFAELVVYTVMIILVGSLLFQWRFFCLLGYKMWSWAMPLKLKTWCYEHLHSHRISV